MSMVTSVKNSNYSEMKVKLSHYRPGQALRGSRRLRLPDF
jgi:hypothetical protein